MIYYDLLMLIGVIYPVSLDWYEWVFISFLLSSAANLETNVLGIVPTGGSIILSGYSTGNLDSRRFSFSDANQQSALFRRIPMSSSYSRFLKDWFLNLTSWHL